jgi:O-glycosyl hydrolase
MGILKWLSLAKKEKIVESWIILACFLCHKRILVSNFVAGGYVYVDANNSYMGDDYFCTGYVGSGADCRGEYGEVYPRI